MTTTQHPDYQEDVKDMHDLKETVQHLEMGDREEGDIPYPETLKNMPEAPTVEMLRQAFELQKSDAALPRE